MNVKQQKMLSRFGQVLTFLDQNANLIPAASVAGQRQVLQAAVDQIGGFRQDQIVKGTETVLSQSVNSTRVALRDTFMRQLSTVGLHSLTGKRPTDPDVPGAAQIFAFPATRTNSSTLIAAATAMVQAATPYAAIFTAAGVNLDAVTTAIQQLQAAVNAEGGARRVSKGATQGIKTQIQAGQGAVRMMDVVVRPLLAANKPLLTQWESVKRSAGGLNLAAPVPVSTAASPAATAPAATAPATSSSSTTQPASASAPTTAAA